MAAVYQGHEFQKKKLVLTLPPGPAKQTIQLQLPETWKLIFGVAIHFS